ncbi:MAG TPA: hypothetical protein VK348_08030 [Planctomycetota bacterium]|nr:hypothetical protein [Planctomycetota bacterium]
MDTRIAGVGGMQGLRPITERQGGRNHGSAFKQALAEQQQREQAAEQGAEAAPVTAKRPLPWALQPKATDGRKDSAGPAHHVDVLA